MDGVDGNEIVEECASEGVELEYFDVLSLISWFAYEKPVDAVSGDSEFGAGCSVVEVVSKVSDSAFVVVESFAFTEYWLLGVSNIEVDGTAVSFMVPFADIVVTDGVADGPDEVLVDELFWVLFEVLFADFVFLSEKDRFDMSRDAADKFVAECFDCASSHVS